MTRIFFLGNEKNGGWFKRLNGTVLPFTLAVIFALSIIMGVLHSEAVVENAAAKKILNAYYAGLNAHNAGEQNEIR